MFAFASRTIGIVRERASRENLFVLLLVMALSSGASGKPGAAPNFEAAQDAKV